MSTHQCVNAWTSKDAVTVYQVSAPSLIEGFVPLKLLSELCGHHGVDTLAAGQVLFLQLLWRGSFLSPGITPPPRLASGSIWKIRAEKGHE